MLNFTILNCTYITLMLWLIDSRGQQLSLKTQRIKRTNQSNNFSLRHFSSVWLEARFQLFFLSVFTMNTDGFIYTNSFKYAMCFDHGALPQPLLSFPFFSPPPACSSSLPSISFFSLLFLYVSVCVYLCMSVCVYLSVCVSVHACVYVYVHEHVCICVHACVRECVVCLRECVCTCVR